MRWDKVTEVRTEATAQSGLRITVTEELCETHRKPSGNYTVLKCNQRYALPSSKGDSREQSFSRETYLAPCKNNSNSPPTDKKSHPVNIIQNFNVFFNIIPQILEITKGLIHETAGMNLNQRIHEINV